jgi:hypothetical protein
MRVFLHCSFLAELLSTPHPLRITGMDSFAPQSIPRVHFGIGLHKKLPHPNIWSFAPISTCLHAEQELIASAFRVANALYEFISSSQRLRPCPQNLRE